MTIDILCNRIFGNTPEEKTLTGSYETERKYIQYLLAQCEAIGQPLSDKQTPGNIFYMYITKHCLTEFLATLNP